MRSILPVPSALRFSKRTAPSGCQYFPASRQPFQPDAHLLSLISCTPPCPSHSPSLLHLLHQPHPFQRNHLLSLSLYCVMFYLGPDYLGGPWVHFRATELILERGQQLVGFIPGKVPKKQGRTHPLTSVPCLSCFCPAATGLQCSAYLSSLSSWEGLVTRDTNRIVLLRKNVSQE